MKNSKNKIIMSISVTALLFVLSFTAVAQNLEIGARFMPTVSSLKMNTSDGGTLKGEVTFGYGIGAYVAYNFTKHFGLQAEFIYNSLSQKYKESDVENKINLKYINIPVLLSFNTGKSSVVNLNIVAGPQVGISVGSNIHTSASGGSVTSNGVLVVKTGDFGIAYGAGLDFGLNSARTFRIGFGFRGVVGLVDISDDSKTVETDKYYILQKTHINTYSAYIGLSFLFGNNEKESVPK